jgi:predicted nucleic acid-binding protein
MHRLFLDANILFSAAYKPDARVLRLWKLPDVVLCTSRYALEEARYNLSDETQRQRLSQLAEGFQFFEGAHHQTTHSISLPEKDIPILLAAIESRARYLLTGDLRHFGTYFGRKFSGVTIASPAQYFAIRQAQSEDK